MMDGRLTVHRVICQDHLITPPTQEVTVNFIDKLIAGEYGEKNQAAIERLLPMVENDFTDSRHAARCHEMKVRYANGDSKFAIWLAAVDTKVQRVAGVGLFDLGDWLIRDAYDSGFTPTEAAREALAQDDTFGGLFE